MNTQTITADLAKMNARLEALGALVIDGDEVVGIDTSKAPASLLGAYSRLVSYGYANGLI